MQVGFDGGWGSISFCAFMSTRHGANLSFYHSMHEFHRGFPISLNVHLHSSDPHGSNTSSVSLLKIHLTCMSGDRTSLHVPGRRIRGF